MVIHTRDAEDDTAAALAGFGGTVVLHCFSSPQLRSVAAQRGTTSLLPETSPFPKPATSVRRRRSPRDRLLAETDSPYLAPQPRARPAERAGERRAHALPLLPRRGARTPRAAARIDAQRQSGASGSRERAPKKRLGQHFLVDENILGVIERLAELGPDDIVLEVGPGLGVLTALLADRVDHVHAVELDRSLEPHLAELAERPNVDLHFGDALQLDLAALEPAPTKLVANLPYNVATPIVAESLDGLPSLGSGA